MGFRASARCHPAIEIDETLERDLRRMDCRVLQQKMRKNTKYARDTRYRRSVRGFLVYLYSNKLKMVNGVLWRKAHTHLGMDLMPRDAFYTWAMMHPDYQRLYAAWTLSKYNKKLTPVSARINADKGFVKDNMEWMTACENNVRSAYAKNKKTTP